MLYNNNIYKPINYHFSKSLLSILISLISINYFLSSSPFFFLFLGFKKALNIDLLFSSFLGGYSFYSSSSFFFLFSSKNLALYSL
jgi:hypothetical protein